MPVDATPTATATPASPTTTPSATATSTPASTESAAPSDPFGGSPTDTPNIARNVLANLEQESANEPADASTDASGEKQTGETPVAAVEPEKPAAAQADDDLMKDFGLKPREDGKEHRIPESRVKQMLAKKIQKVQETATAQLAEHTTKIQSYEQQIETFTRNLEDPNVLIPLLASHPKYAAIFAGLDAQPGQPQARPDPNAGKPEPDYDLGNGSFTYSDAGLQKLMEWRDAQTEARILKQLDPYIAPLKQQHETEQFLAAEGPKVMASIEDAMTWPGFKENFDEIQKAFLSDKSLKDLNAAYRKIVIPKLTADRKKMYDELVEQMRAQPTSTSMTAGITTSSAARGGPQSTADVARRILAGG